MTEYIADTPRLGRDWCPACDPTGDPLREILDVRPCDEHRAIAGAEDFRVDTSESVSGCGEADPDVMRAFAALFR